MITLYTTHCPKCKILTKKLTEKNIEYIEFTDVDKMIEMGFNIMPMLEVDGVVMDFTTANKWINEFKENKETEESK